MPAEEQYHRNQRTRRACQPLEAEKICRRCAAEVGDYVGKRTGIRAVVDTKVIAYSARERVRSSEGIGPGCKVRGIEE